MIKVFEYARWLCCAIGFYLAYAHLSTESVYWLCLLVTIPLSGLTALESLLFGNKSALHKQREIGSDYQTQSALNNLATAIAATIVVVFKLGVSAEIALSLVSILFFFFSSIKHGLEYFIEHKPAIHLLRFLSSIVLVAASVPIFVAAWPH